MKKTFIKQTLSVFIAILVVTLSLPVCVATDDSVVSGSLGNTVQWTLYDQERLVITGNGTMRNPNSSSSGCMFYAGTYKYKTTVKTVVIESGITNIANGIFSGCSNIESISIPDTVTEIGSYAFRGCTNLTEIRIPDGVTSIKDYTFTGCIHCRLYIPASVNSIVTKHQFGPCAFISVDENNTVYSSDANGALYNKVKSELYSFPYDGVDSPVIPNSVRILSDYAFSNTCIKTINLHNGVTELGQYCFSHSEDLEQIALPNSLNTIGENAFQYCTSLRSIIIPNSISKLAGWTFYHCDSLQNVNLPENLTSLPSYTFSDCSSIENIVLPRNLISISSGVFQNCVSLKTITIFKNLKSIYSNSSTKPFTNCINLNDVYYEGTEEDWAKVSGRQNLGNATIHFGVIPETSVMTANYSFENDSFNFENRKVETSLLDYQNVFGILIGAVLYGLLPNAGATGVCAGMALTNKALFENRKAVSNFNVDRIRLLQRTSTNSTYNKLEDVIKYGQIFTKSFWWTIKRSNGIENVLETIKQNVEDGKLTIIGLEGGNKGNNHAVLAVGLKNNQIIIDDPNEKNVTLLLNYSDNGEWSYTSPNLNTWTSSNSSIYTINCCDDFMTSVGNRLLLETPADILVRHSLLILDKFVIGADFYCNLKTYPISADYGNLENAEKESISPNVYWLDGQDEVILTNNGNKDECVTLVGEDTQVKSVLSENMTTEINLNDQSKETVTIKLAREGNIDTTITRVKDENTIEGLRIQGTSSGETVTIKQVEKGAIVTGLENMDITYLKDDVVVDTAQQMNNAGEETVITITEEDDIIISDDQQDSHTHTYTSAITTDPTCTADGETTYTCTICGDTYTEPIPATGEHIDADNDGYCDTCEEMMTGGQHCKYCGKIHGGLFGWLVKFFHSIFAIFKR